MPQSNLELGVFVGASATMTGTNGLVPRPTAGQQNSVLGASGEWVPALTNPLSTPLVINGGTVTESTPVLDLSQTWNLAGTTFVADTRNIIDSASSGSSLYVDWKRNSSSIFKIDKTGVVYLYSVLSFGGTGDTLLARGAANTLALRNLANAQALQIYGTADAGLLNYRRLAISVTTAGIASIDVEGLGTGVAGNGIRVGGITVGKGGVTAVNGNTAVGLSALNSASVTGQGNSGFGEIALQKLTSGPANTAVGYNSLTEITTGGYNTGVGYAALANNTTAGNNNAFGYSALRFNTTGTANNAFGHSALYSNTTGNYNTAVGGTSLLNNTTGSYNTAVGYNSQYISTNATYNTSTGATTLFDSTGSYNCAFGYSSLRYNTTGQNNSAYGYAALFLNTTGQQNAAFGYGASYANVVGDNNTAIGYNSMPRLQGAANTALGAHAGVGINRGVASVGSITGGTGYTDGTYPGVALTYSSGSRFSGAPTATVTVSGGAVTAVAITQAGLGFYAADTILTASAATIGGTGSGFSVPVTALTGATSSNNTLVGYQAGYLQTEGSNNIAIGASANLDSLTGSNQINVGGVYFHDRFVYVERTDPAAPAVNSAVVYARDNGSGKTQLCVRFNTGAVQVISTEP